jgi:hypothetical protein
MILIAAAACLAGCTPGYTVHVNTFADPNRAAIQGASVHVVGDPNSRNPILGRQIASKINELLRGYGYNPVDTADRANYVLTFEAGFNSNQVVDYTPMYRPFGGFSAGFGGRFHQGGFGYTTYMPYIDTIYVHWLRMKLYTKDGAALNQANVIWLGEAVTGADNPELRQAVNYLLVGCTEYFGVDTHEWATVTIKKDDPRIQGIAEVAPEQPAKR